VGDEIRFGLFLPQWRLGFDELTRRARAAEAAGFDTLWLMDHLWPPAAPDQDCLEAWTLATALAMRTEHLRIGHMVLCNPLRHPALLAKMAATLDVISGGRLELGIGWGSAEAELEAFGIGAAPARERAERLAESLEILRLLFTGEPVDYEGVHFRLRGALARPRPLRGSIPIHVGGAGPKLTMPIVARHADWWNCVSYGVERLAELVPLAGSARISVQHPVALITDPARAERTLADAQRRFGAWGGLLSGDPDEVAAALRAEVDLGARAFVIQLSDYGEVPTIEHFAREVIPRVRDACRDPLPIPTPRR
jgi:alkanesulfonate monooxygenase SsuD/methylene tetrahydromethanopterin reductase-like flavin-dependent oxidoreductase (luciferase family)